MTEIELYNELQNVEGCLKIADSQISELRKKKNAMVVSSMRYVKTFMKLFAKISSVTQEKEKTERMFNSKE